MSYKLDPDSRVPSLNLPLVGGGSFDLASSAPEMFTMVVFYRGKHCLVCNSYIQKLDGLVQRFRDAGVETVAVSMDPEDRAKESIEEWGIQNTRVAYGLSEESAREWGLYISSSIKEGENRIFNEPGLFWVRPDGRLYLIDISNMPWARPDLEFLLSKLTVVKERNYPARGTKLAT